MSYEHLECCSPACSWSVAVATPVGATGILPPDNPSTNLAPTPNFLSSGLCHLTAVATPCTNPCVRLVGPANGTASALPRLQRHADVHAVRAARTQHRAQRRRPADDRVADELVSTETAGTDLRDRRPRTNGPRSAAVSGTQPQAPRRRAVGRRARERPRPSPRAFAAGLDPRRRARHGRAPWRWATPRLEADYMWMYEDGWGGSSSSTPNLACTFAGALGCWGHRDQLLGFDGTYNFGVGLHCTTCEMGTGFAVVNGTGSLHQSDRTAGRIAAADVLHVGEERRAVPREWTLNRRLTTGVSSRP